MVIVELWNCVVFYTRSPFKAMSADTNGTVSMTAVRIVDTFFGITFNETSIFPRTHWWKELADAIPRLSKETP